MTMAGTGCDLTLDQIKHILDDLAASGVKAIHFLGGEPFARPDFFDVLEHCALRGIRFGINTNGVFITRWHVDRLIELSDYLADLTFSLDGGDAATNDLMRSPGSFAGVVRGLRLCLDSPLGDLEGNPINTNTCITKPLLRSLDNFFNLIDSMPRLRRLTFGHLHVTGAARNVVEDLLVTDKVEVLDFMERVSEWAAARPHLQVSLPASPLVLDYLNARFGTHYQFGPTTCPAGSILSYIDARGNMYPCNNWSVLQFVEEFGVTRWTNNNLKVVSFDEVYNSPSWQSFFRFVHDPAVLALRHPCGSCKFVDSCYTCPVSVVQAGVKVAETCLLAMERRRQYVEDRVSHQVG